jgi:prepilin-type N-terminal cleavage/methylation domain-containing protein
MPRRRAFTLIELLVSLAVIAILLAIAIPAAQHARESARKHQCQSNLKQIGRALYNYEASFRVFPPGRFRSHIDGRQLCFSTHAYLLPYLDQAQLYRSINFNAPADLGPENRAARQTALSVFQCPADYNTQFPGDDARHSYAANAGTQLKLAESDGIFFENSRLMISDIRDGTSNTVFFSETIQSDGTPLHDLFLTPGNDNQSVAPVLTNYVTQIEKAKMQVAERGVCWLYGAPGNGLYNHRRTPNSPSFDCRGGLPHSNVTNALADNLSHDVAARSRHRGGVHVLAGDGVVRFISNTVNPDVWRLISIPNDGNGSCDCEP